MAFGLFSAWVLLGAFSAYRIAGFFASLVEDAIDEWTEVSYVNITKGDEIEILKAQRKNRFTVIKGVAGFLLTVSISVATKIIANLLTA